MKVDNVNNIVVNNMPFDNMKVGSAKVNNIPIDNMKVHNVNNMPFGNLKVANVEVDSYIYGRGYCSRQSES
jgi:hypothetical protein